MLLLDCPLTSTFALVGWKLWVSNHSCSICVTVVFLSYIFKPDEVVASGQSVLHEPRVHVKRMACPIASLHDLGERAAQALNDSLHYRATYE